MRHPWQGLGGLPRGVWIVAATTFINRLGTMALPFLVLYLTRSRGFTPPQAGFVVMIYGLAAILTGPLSGRLCDRIGTLSVLRGSLFLSGLVLLIYPLARSYTATVLLTIAWAFTNEASRPANLAMYSELVPPSQRRAAFAVARLAVNLGMSVGPAAGGFIAMVSFPAIFLVDGATSLLAGAALSIWGGQLSAARPAPGSASGGAIDPTSGPRRPYTDRRLLYFLAALLPVLMVFFQHEAAMSLFMVRNLGLPESSVGLLFTINTMLIILFEVPFNLKTAGWPYRRALALGALLVGAGFGGLALSTGMRSVAATVVVWSVGEMVLLPVSSAYVADIAPAGSRGAYLGLYTMSFSVAFALGPWIGAVTLDRLGPWFVWGGSFLFGLLSALMMSRIRSHPQPATEPPPPLMTPAGEAV